MKSLLQAYYTYTEELSEVQTQISSRELKARSSSVRLFDSALRRKQVLLMRSKEEPYEYSNRPSKLAP